MTNTETRDEYLRRMRHENRQWQIAHEMTIADPANSCGDPNTYEHDHDENECDYRRILIAHVNELLPNRH